MPNALLALLLMLNRKRSDGASRRTADGRDPRW
jgi:hypothetical protein